MNTAESQLESLIAEAGARLKRSAVLLGLCWWLAVCLGLWLALFAFDGLLGLPAGLRLPLTVAGAVFSGLHLYQKVLRVALRRQSPERTALTLEKRYGIGENLLINAVQAMGGGGELLIKLYSQRGHAMIELAHEAGFKPTRPLRESLKMSREYVKSTLGF